MRRGEADAVGWPTFFIRLTGCPLRCTYCDTTYAFQGGEWHEIDALVAAARSSGEPGLQVTATVFAPRSRAYSTAAHWAS